MSRAEDKGISVAVTGIAAWPQSARCADEECDRPVSDDQPRSRPRYTRLESRLFFIQTDAAEAACTSREKLARPVHWIVE